MRRTAAQIAAAAIFELYPDIELLGGGDTSTGFFYDFYFPHPVHTHIIEEKMSQIVREKRAIRTLEMVPLSARELLKSQGHLKRAKEVANEQLVDVIQIGSFHDLSEGPHLKNTAELAAFKIEAEPTSDKRMRITGWCDRSKKDLKHFLKKFDVYKEPELIGEGRGYWRNGIWMAGGLEFKEKLIQFLKKSLFQGALEISGPLGVDRMALHASLNLQKVAEIWAPDPHETHLQISFFSVGEAEFISSLHLIGKTLTILGFNQKCVPGGLGTDFVVVDQLDRSHSLVRVKKRVKKGGDLIDFKIEANLEKILLQMIENNLEFRKLENQ